MSMKYCTNCGSPLAEGAKFCTNCGTQVVAPAPGPTQPQPTPPAPAQAPAPAPAAKTPGTPSVAPVIKDLFASASSGMMIMSSWTASNPEKKAVAVARTMSNPTRTVQDKTERKRRGGCLRFFIIILIIAIVLLAMPSLLGLVGLGGVGDALQDVYEALLNFIIG